MVQHAQEVAVHVLFCFHTALINASYSRCEIVCLCRLYTIQKTFLIHICITIYTNEPANTTFPTMLQISAFHKAIMVLHKIQLQVTAEILKPLHTASNLEPMSLSEYSYRHPPTLPFCTGLNPASPQ